MPPDPKDITWDAPDPKGIVWDDAKAAPPKKTQPPQTLLNNSFTTGLQEGVEPGGLIAGGIGDLIGAGMRAVGIATRDTSKPLPSTVTVPGQYLTPGTVKDENYIPQERGGKYARTLGQFASGAVAGPAGIIPRVASVAVPALASEALGQAAEGTRGELPLRLAGSVIGGGVSGALQRGATSLANVLKGVKSVGAADAVAPTVADLKSVATENYNTLRLPENNPIIRKEALSGLRDRIKQVLSDQNFHPDDEPKTARLWARIDELPNDHSTLTGLEKVRSHANKVAGNFGTSDGAMAAKVKAEITDFMSGLKDEDIIGTEALGPIKLAGPEAAQAAGPVPGIEELTKARKAWHTMKKGAMIEAIVDTADIRGDANYTQAGKDGALRRGFANLAVNPKKMAQFTPTEQDAIKLVAKGSPTQNALRRLGSMAVRGPVSAASTSVLGHMVGGPAGPYILGGIAEAAKAGSATATEGNVQALQALVRGGPEAVEALSMNRRKELAKALAKYGPAAITSGGILTNAGATALANE